MSGQLPSLGCFISPDHRATLEAVKKEKYHIISLLGIEQWSAVVQPIAWLPYHLFYPGRSIVCDDLCKNAYLQPAAPQVRVVVVLLVITDILCPAGDWWQISKGFKGKVFSFSGLVMLLIWSQIYSDCLLLERIIWKYDNKNMSSETCGHVCL